MININRADEERDVSSTMLGQRLFTNETPSEGLPVDKVYVVEQLAAGHPFYLAITTDRTKACPVLVMSKGGSSAFEALTAAREPKSLVKAPLDYAKGVTAEVVSTICETFELHADSEHLTALLHNLFTFFKERDATRIEIKPLLRESTTGRLVCANPKVSIDNAASKRQAQIFDLHDRSQDMAVELEAEKYGLVYIQLEGNIGCLVNGAGLAMATNDAVAYYGGRCANFLDGGGQATKETMMKAFELILSDKRVNTILVNIYGGGSDQACLIIGVMLTSLIPWRHYSLRYDSTIHYRCRPEFQGHTNRCTAARDECSSRTANGMMLTSRAGEMTYPHFRLRRVA